MNEVKLELRTKGEQRTYLDGYNAAMKYCLLKIYNLNELLLITFLSLHSCIDIITSHLDTINMSILIND